MAEAQDRVGARLLFNTLVPFESGLIKYGVISRAAMLADLGRDCWSILSLI